LFNALTKSQVFADDRLFATLDPTLRRLRLPQGTVVILSDTVGFVADLPTSLVAAFRATLEEVAEADLVLHVRDIAHPDSEAQAGDVATVLSELGVDAEAPDRVIEVWNKIDLLPKSRRPPRFQPQRTNGEAGPMAVAVSALTGEGLPELLAAIEERVAAGASVFDVELAGEGLSQLHRLYELGEVLDRSDRDDGTTLSRVRVAKDAAARFRREFPKARPAGQ
jgi:GTP-binding protein HflX